MLSIFPDAKQLSQKCNLYNYTGLQHFCIWVIHNLFLLFLYLEIRIGTKIGLNLLL